MNKRPIVLITGAGGFLGSALVEYFSHQGWQVIALVRNAKKYSNAAVRYVEFDLAADFDDRVFAGADYLVHAAYIKYDYAHPQALEQNVEGAKRLLAASRKYSLKKNLFVSTMSAHEGAVSVYGQQKLAIERLFDQPQDAVIRSGLIVGNGGIVREMVDFMRTKHLVPLVDGGKQPLQIIAVADLVTAIERTLTSTIHGLAIIATPRVYSYREFYQAIADCLHIKVFMIPVPFWALLAMLRVASVVHISLGISEDNLWGLRKLQSAKTAKDLEEIGLVPQELDAALQAIAAKLN